MSSWRCAQLIKYGDNFTFNMNISLKVRISFIKQEFILLTFIIESEKLVIYCGDLVCEVCYESFVFHCTPLSQALDPGTVRVTVRQGVMRGKTMTSAKGRTFYAFQRIPYAKPPTGLLRFRVSASYIGCFTTLGHNCRR
jgi:hypothetical protein